MATPTVGREGGIDEDALEDYTKFLLDEGAHGLFPCGSTGEFSSFSREKRKAVIRTVVDSADSTPVLAGCGDTSIPVVLTLINDAAMAGADAAVVVTPYYLETNELSLCEFYELVADETPLPVILYHIPELTGQHLPVTAVVRLADHEQIIGIKDTSRDLHRLWEIIDRTPSSFHVFQGATTLAVPSLRMGADGIVPTSGNVFPNTLATVYDRCDAGDYSKASSLMHEIVFPFISSFTKAPGLSAIKHLIGQAGPAIGPPASPLPMLSDEQKEQLVSEYQELVERTTNSPVL